MSTFAIEYFILVFLAGVGVIQIAAAIAGLNGILILKPPLIARIIGSTLILAAFIWFFTTRNRSINDYEGGLDSNEQSLVFFLAIIAAGAFTFTLSSLINIRMKPTQQPSPEDGIAALKHTTYLRALAHNLNHWLTSTKHAGKRR